MSIKEFLPLPTGKDNFAELKDKNRYYVDKTPHLKQVFAVDDADILLFTRPRRFGKTLLMNMFESFLNINYEKPGDTTIHQNYFKDTKIFDDKEFCKKYMGQFPVLSITLKDVQGKTLKQPT